MKYVFVGGCSRSGTTMLGSMLGAGRDAVCVPESGFLFRSLPARYAREGVDLFEARGLDTAKLLRRISNHPRFVCHWGLDYDPSKIPPEQLGESLRSVYEWMARDFARRQGKPEPSWVVEQSPSSVRCAALLSRWIPDAKFIHLIRDGRAVAASILKADLGPSTIDRAALYWLQWLSFGLAAETYLHADRIIRVRYEDVVLHPESTLRELCAFVGLEYDPAMVQGTSAVVTGYNVGQHALVGTGPQASRVDAWRRSLTPREIEIFEFFAGDMLALVGYVSEYGPTARGPGLGERLRFKVARLLSYPKWLISMRRRVRAARAGRRPPA